MTDVDLPPVTEPDGPDHVTAWANSLPWWRRPRRMRRQLSVSLAAVSLVSVLLVGGLNFYAARELLQDGTREQLVSIAESRARSIEEGADRVLDRVAALSADLAVARAVVDFSCAYEALDGIEVAESDVNRLTGLYEERLVEPLREVGSNRTIEDTLPRTDAGIALQLRYVVGDDDIALHGDGSAATDETRGDGAERCTAENREYEAVYDTYDEYVTGLAETLAISDIKLVDASGNVVYSVAKKPDFATNLVSGPHDDSALADTLVNRLTRARAGDALMTDFELYVPNLARPAGFAIASVRSGSDLVGAFVVEIAAEVLSGITTADGQWEDVGLDEGESYLVANDRRFGNVLRSESRLWIEDPDGYLDRVDDELLRAQIEFLDSPVSIQPANTQAVRTATDGDIFEGRAENYLGQDVYSYARLIDVAGVNWVVVADVPYADVRSPLATYLFRIGITLLVLLPLAGLIGVAMASRVTEPIPRILGAADDVVAGERDPELPDFGRNEFGDLATRLRRTAGRLGQQEADLETQFEETRAVLLSALPPAAVGGEGTTLSNDGDVLDVGTAISVAIDLHGDDVRVDDTLSDLFARASRVAEEVAAELGIERVRAAADRYLFIAGLGAGTDGADAALELAAELARRARDFASREEIGLELRIGVSTGPVETGLMSLGNLSYTAWGDPVRDAMVIGSLSSSTMVGVHETTVRAADPDRWVFDDAPEVIGLDDRPLRVFGLDDIRPSAPDSPTVS